MLMTWVVGWIPVGMMPVVASSMLLSIESSIAIEIVMMIGANLQSTFVIYGHFGSGLEPMKVLENLSLLIED